MRRKKAKRAYAKSEERPEGKKLRRFRVRCARTVSFYIDVDAYTLNEAEFIGELYCSHAQCDVWNPSGHAPSDMHVSTSFEAEED